MGFEFQKSRMCHSPRPQTERRCAKRANWPPSPPDPPFADYFRRGPCAGLQKASEEVAECEPPTRKPAPTIRTTRKAKPNINGLPNVGGLWPVAMNFRGHWDVLFRRPAHRY